MYCTCTDKKNMSCDPTQDLQAAFLDHIDSFELLILPHPVCVNSRMKPDSVSCVIST